MIALANGERFGRLIVVGPAPMRPNHSVYVTCRCDCGTTKEVRAWNLRRGMTTSCGCLSSRRRPPVYITHGDSRPGRTAPEYAAWRGLINRCTNARDRKWALYGGRGITVCARWRHSYEAFLADVGRRPGPGHSIDRIDPDGHYEPGNVRWADIYTQNRNRRFRRKA